MATILQSNSDMDLNWAEQMVNEMLACRKHQKRQEIACSPALDVMAGLNKTGKIPGMAGLGW